MIMILITNIKENIKSRIKNTVVKFLQSWYSDYVGTDADCRAPWTQVTSGWKLSLITVDLCFLQ